MTRLPAAHTRQHPRNSVASACGPGGQSRLTFVSALLLVVALSLDSLGVGVAYGLRGIRLPWTLYVIVALCTGVLMTASMVAGGRLAACLSPGLARRLGGLVLVGVGLWQLHQGWQAYRRRLAPAERPRQVLRLGVRSLGLVVQILVEPAAADVDRSGEIESPESVALGLALGLDSLGAGAGAALAGYSPLVVPLVALGCAASVWLGLSAGRLPAVRRAMDRTFAAGAIILLGLGLLRLR